MAIASGMVKPIDEAPARVARSPQRATEVRTYELLARVLVDAGVDRIFCVMGDANLELMADAASACGIRLVHARHEQGAVAMADGFARASGELSVCSVTCGPGLTNAATSLATAARHGSSVLLLAGDVALATGATCNGSTSAASSRRWSSRAASQPRQVRPWPS